MQANKNDRRLRWVALLAWFAFVAGLLIQLFSPRLEISDGAFVIPPTLSVEGNSIQPDAIVARERWTQFISAFLTVGGALALAYRYRHSFTRRTSAFVPQNDRHPTGD